MQRITRLSTERAMMARVTDSNGLNPVTYSSRLQWLCRHDGMQYSFVLLQLALFLSIFCLPRVALSFDLGLIGYHVDAGQELSGKTRVITIGGWDNFHGGVGRIGLSLIESDPLGNTLGLDLAVAGFTTSPDHVAPYVGYGLFAGYSDRRRHVVGALYPELGLHFPISGKWDLTIGAKYYLTTDGADHAFLISGIGLRWEWE